jgi:predicted Zn-dependent protease
VRVIRVKAGDTPQSLARQMGLSDNQLDRFLVLNGLDANAVLKPGDRVKLIVR